MHFCLYVPRCAVHALTAHRFQNQWLPRFWQISPPANLWLVDFPCNYVRLVDFSANIWLVSFPCSSDISWFFCDFCDFSVRLVDFSANPWLVDFPCKSVRLVYFSANIWLVNIPCSSNIGWFFCDFCEIGWFFCQSMIGGFSLQLSEIARAASCCGKFLIGANLTKSRVKLSLS